MKAAWYRDLGSNPPAADKKRRSEELNRFTLNLLKEILQSKIPTFVPSTDYDDPSWAYKQADRNGYVRALKEVIELIELDGK